jgi:hypothetical protein
MTRLMSLWKEHFDFYEAAAKTGRAFVNLDLAAAPHAPVSTHPVRLQFRVKMKQPREDGLRSNEEAEALFLLEDRLVEALRSKHEAIYIARAVAYGYSEFYFYVPSQHRNAADALALLLKSFAPYEVEWLADDDANWDRYFALYPNRYARQTMLNRALLQQMVEANDRLEIPRVVDHSASFPTREQADAAAKALIDAGFDVDPVAAPNEAGDEWGLEFHREDACDAENADEFSFEVLDLITPHDGAYGGWGSEVQAEPTAKA